MNEYLGFMRERLGANWVLARRTSRIVRQYGENVNCVSAKQLAKVERDYRALYGDPYDTARRDMYLALVATRSHLASSFDTESAALEKQINRAISAEIERK